MANDVESMVTAADKFSVDVVKVYDSSPLSQLLKLAMDMSNFRTSEREESLEALRDLLLGGAWDHDEDNVEASVRGKTIGFCKWLRDWAGYTNMGKTIRQERFFPAAITSHTIKSLSRRETTS